MFLRGKFATLPLRSQLRGESGSTNVSGKNLVEAYSMAYGQNSKHLFQIP